MRDQITNPFAESTLTEHIAPEDFVQIFSPLIVQNAEALFRQGNVVLKGTPGSGKSMLLALLKPETRIAYCKNRIDFPVKEVDRRFISAGINLTKAGTQDFGNRLNTNHAPGLSHQDLSFYFADFFNYYLVLDLLNNVKKFQPDEFKEIQKDIGLKVDDESLDIAAKKIASDSVWFGYLEGINNYKDLIEKLEERILLYRSFFNFNSEDIAKEIQETKTPIGEPLGVVANVLRNLKIISATTQVFIRIDQVEELYHLESHYGLGNDYRKIINKALAMRDQRISYRIGTRGYAWEAESLVYGTGSKLEEERDYVVVEIENILKRSENRRLWCFPELAADIFNRRLESAGYKFKGAFNPKEVIKRVLGTGLNKNELAMIYAGSAPERILDLDSSWPEPWKNYLRELSIKDPLAAKFGEAWARQRGKSNVVNEIPLTSAPWDQKKWWKKERQELALCLIASRAGQRIIWSGVDDVLELSNGNALTFITLCRHIWQAFLRSSPSEYSNSTLPSIDPLIQATGIYDASKSWMERIIPRGFNGDSRAKVVNIFGTWFAKSLAADKAMSYPGHNGFSVSIEDLSATTQLKKILEFSSDFGDLVSGPHTTKSPDRKPRIKWYLAPILSPYFRIPHVHTKEPIYTTGDQILKLLKISSEKVSEVSEATNSAQLNLFR